MISIKINFLNKLLMSIVNITEKEAPYSDSNIIPINMHE